ncbi:GNAT family N-acetyltransferase [Aliishimia ponticola]|uniref:GNAT family N-acetyltransferase n=2 Tax=Aliishimia ponticola TaxID=2499833 RepID=A0A4S4NLL0_9RHOB|nr:GNAT family N-acetyltransferase [Aliishimia ponticola]
MSPLSQEAAAAFWSDSVRPDVARGDRLLLGAVQDGRLIGTVQLVLAMPPNQPHRGEISKMIVHPEGRRLGLGTALMQAALRAAKDAGKTIVTLDTRSGDVSEGLYRRVGFEVAGTIPDYAFDPDGIQRHATTYMYRYV